MTPKGEFLMLSLHRYAVLVAIVLALALVPVARATAPTTETMVAHPHFVLANACGSFSIVSDFNSVRRVTTFYDQDGTPIRRVVHAKIPGTITNSATGKTLTSFGERVIITDLITGAVSSTGTNVHVVVPGEGTVELGAGHFGIDDDGVPFADGRLDSAAPAALCEALSAA